MCSDKDISAVLTAVLFMALSLLAFSCVPGTRISELGTVAGKVGLSVADDGPSPYADGMDQVIVDSTSAVENDGPVIMNAIRDSRTGEMVATDVIPASRVTARFRNVAERAGRISLQFDVTVPWQMVRSDFQLKFMPKMTLFCGNPANTPEDSVMLEPFFITGARYRQAQLRGYQRYEAFLNSIITDSTVFIRKEQLEIFLKRFFPMTYSMKTDSSFISEPLAENLFGVNQKTALEHYTKHYLKDRNNRRSRDREKMFRKFVKDPILTENIRLDTVIASPDGNIVYRYVQDMFSRPGLKKVVIGLGGTVFKDGECIFRMPGAAELSFYISSLSTLADNTPRYKFRILEKVVTDNTNAFIDFGKGSAVLDTLLPGNASELKRIRKCFSDMVSKEEYVVDSVVVTASCSPEGTYRFNEKLARQRSLSILEYVSSFTGEDSAGYLKASSVPENWTYFRKLVANDSIISPERKAAIIRISEMPDHDAAEKMLSSEPEYRYLREKIYPKLRTVSFSFHLHRKDMQKDTVHTTELDTVYMNGLAAMRALDYKSAAALLKPYMDYNSALALASSGYDDTALSILEKLDRSDAKTCYLAALLLSRLGREEEAVAFYDRSVMSDPSMAHRANLDPEMSGILKLRARK